MAEMGGQCVFQTISIIAGVGDDEGHSNVLEHEGLRIEARDLHQPRFQKQIDPIIGHPELIRQKSDLSPSKAAYQFAGDCWWSILQISVNRIPCPEG
jgi:hypothetical protein